MPAPLETFLHYYTSGHNVLTPEMWDHFGGADMLSALQKYDPSAHVTTVDIGGGEGGPQGQGFRIDFDVTKLPTSKRGEVATGLSPANLHGNLRTSQPAYDDPIYGSVRNSSEFARDTDPMWVKLAPLVVGAVAPMAGAALAGAGVGGAAGLTAGVTGSGLGAASNLPGWLVQALQKSPQLAQQLASGNKTGLLNSFLNVGGGALGLPTGTIKAGMTLAELARQRGR